MAIKIGGTTVINDSRQLSNIASVDATTVAALGTAGVGGGGGSTELTAASSLSAGQAVVVNSSGQAAAVTKTVGTIASGTSAASIEHGISHAEAYDSVNKKLLWIVKNSASQNYVKWGHANITESTGAYSGQGDNTWKTNTQYGSSMAMAFSPVAVHFLAAVSDGGSNNTLLFTLDFNGNTRTEVNAISISPRAGGVGSYDMVYDAGIDAFIVVVAGGYAGPSVHVVTTDTNGAGPTERTNATITHSSANTSNFKFPKIATNGNGQFVLTLGDAGSNTRYAYPISITGSIGAGFTITQGTVQTLTTANRQSNTNKHNVSYDSASSKFLFQYRTNSTDSSLAVRSGTVSSNSLTLHTETSVATSNVTGHSTLVADRNATSGLFTSGGYNNAAFHFRTLTVASNGNITVGSATSLTANNSYFTGDGHFNVVPVTGDPSLSSYHLFGVGNNGAELERNHHTRTITSDASKIIGFTEAAISSGATGDITVIGGVNDQQSGLTAGSKHYALSGGEISTDSSGTYAGVALSATKLLVKG